MLVQVVDGSEVPDNLAAHIDFPLDLLQDVVLYGEVPKHVHHQHYVHPTDYLPKESLDHHELLDPVHSPGLQHGVINMQLTEPMADYLITI